MGEVYEHIQKYSENPVEEYPWIRGDTKKQWADHYTKNQNWLRESLNDRLSSMPGTWGHKDAFDETTTDTDLALNPFDVHEQLTNKCLDVYYTEYWWRCFRLCYLVCEACLFDCLGSAYYCERVHTFAPQI